MKQHKFYYYDDKNDLVEYLESDKSVFAVWVNPYLTLMFPHGCSELNPKNAVGFQINGMKHILSKAKEQADIPLTGNQKKQIEEIFTQSGLAFSIDENGDKIWKKVTKEHGIIEKTSISIEQGMDADSGSASN